MELTRKQIKSMLPEDVTFSLRKVSFSDLARSEAVSLKIKRNGEELPSMFFGDEQFTYWKDVLDSVKEIKKHTYKGDKII